MEGHIKIKNIFILLFSFFLGYISNILVLNWQKIDIYSIISSLNEDTIVEEIEVDESINPPLPQTPQEEEQKDDEKDLCPVQIDISGAVLNPGVYCFPKGASVIEAVKKAKGFTSEAGFKYISMKINLATVMLDNTKIYIPFETDYDCSLLTFDLPKEVVDITIPDTEQEEEQEDEQGDNQACISINSATLEELDSLDGIGPSTAQKIIDGRPYAILEDLLNVSGIGELTFNKFKEDICL